MAMKLTPGFALIMPPAPARPVIALLTPLISWAAGLKADDAVIGYPVPYAPPYTDRLDWPGLSGGGEVL